MIQAAEHYKISSLEMENFRQYRHARIEFSRESGKIFTVLRGSNGSGKTNIMNAITWCLYGKEKHLDSNEKDLPIINTKALKEKTRGLAKMRVSLKLADRHGDKFEIERQLSLYSEGYVSDTAYDKDAGAVIPKSSAPSVTQTFHWYDQKSGGWKTTDYFDKSVKDLLPEDLATYFLFDGEKLEDFFEQADNTKKGIEDVSQIKITEQAIETLTKFVSQLRKTFKSLDPKVAEYQEKLADAESGFEECKTTIEMIRFELHEKTSEHKTIENELMKFGGDIGSYQKRARETKDALDGIQESYARLESKKSDYVLEHAIVVNMLGPIDDTIRNIRAKGDEGVLPPKIQESFVMDLLEKGTCICGNDISHGNQSWSRIMEHLNQAKYSQISDICTELKFMLEPMLRLDGVRKELDSMDHELLEYEKQMERYHGLLADLEAKIRGADEQSIKQMADRKSSLQDEISNLNQRLGATRDEKDRYDKNRGEYRRDLDNEMRKDTRQGYLSRKIDFCQESLEELQKVRDNLLDGVQGTVQKYTKEYFLKFLWKKDTYEDVTIDGDYRITARHVDGFDVRVGLSKGEKLILALSFMAALRKITGFGFPLLIDTPLGRVSGEPRHNIAKLLPEILKDNQITLLVTDAEYQAEIQDDENRQEFPAIRDTISGYVGADYDINFVNGESKVRRR